MAVLAAEEALRGRVEVRAQAPQPGQMGAGFDVLAVALGSGGAGAVLARSFRVRRPRPCAACAFFVSSGPLVNAGARTAATSPAAGPRRCGLSPRRPGQLPSRPW
ncbi:effector-associated constant component EACC1 [Streptomyces sp. NPDC054834]